MKGEPQEYSKTYAFGNAFGTCLVQRTLVTLRQMDNRQRLLGLVASLEREKNPVLIGIKHGMRAALTEAGVKELPHI